MKSINTDDLIANAKNFRWKEALWVAHWEVCAFPSDEIYTNIIAMAIKLEQVRAILKTEMKITSWYRPKWYNEWPRPFGANGAKCSYHIRGMAVDFQPYAMDCDKARALLEPLLEKLGLRMEKNPHSNWVHLDCGVPGGSGRYFEP